MAHVQYEIDKHNHLLTNLAGTIIDLSKDGTTNILRNVTDGVLPDDAATKGQLDALAATVGSMAAVGMRFQGGYDANTNTPDLDTSPSGVLKGDTYYITVAGTFFGQEVEPGDLMIAEIDDPLVEADWTVVNKNFQFGTTAGTVLEGNTKLNTLSFSAGRNNNTPSPLYLKRGGNVPTNEAPFVVPFDATLLYVSASCKNPSSWDARIVKDNLIPSPGVGDILYELTLFGETSKVSGLLNISLNAGDIIGLQLVNSVGLVADPGISILIKER